MKSIAIKNKIYFVFGVFIFLFCFTLFGTDQKVENDYKRRILGDQAFNDGLYDVAMNYYKHYLENAGSNTSASRDAYYCLIATCLKANNIKEAERFYKKVSDDNKKYFELNPLEEEKLKYWNAEILLTKGLTEEAKAEFSRIAEKVKVKNKDLYVKSLVGKGICDIRLNEWKNAENSFQTVYAAAEDLSDKRKAAEQLILIKLILGDVDSVTKFIKNESKELKEKSSSQKLLQVYLLIKKDRLDEGEEIFSSFENKLSGDDEVLTYLVLSAFAEGYLKNNKYDKALIKLQESFSKAPNLYEKEMTAILTLNTLIEAKKYKDAAKSAKIFLDFFPDTILKDKILLTYIDILIKIKVNPSKIFPIIEKNYVQVSNPVKVQIDISTKIGKILYQIEDYKNALTYFSYSFKNGINREQCGEALYWEGKCYAKLGDVNKALEELKKIDSKIPEWQEKAMHETAIIYLNQKDFENCKNVLEKYLSKFPKSTINPPALFLYAAALSGNNEISYAIQKYLEFAENNSDNELAAEAYSRAGELNLRISDFKGSMECYQKILDLYPKSVIIPEVLYKLLYSYYLSGGYKKAVEVVKDLNKKYPDSNYSQQASFWLVDYYFFDKKFDKALEQLNIIGEKYQKNKELQNRILYKEADVYFKMKEYQSALEKIDKYIKNCKNQEKLGRAYFLQGDIYSEENSFDRAIESYKNVLTLNSGIELKTASQGRIADCYFAVINFADDRDGAVKLALNAYKELLKYRKLSKFFVIQTNYKLGKCYEILDDTESAIMSYHKALYENIISIDGDKEYDAEWMAKAGIALSRILLEKNTREAAEKAIKIYGTLIEYGIQPENDYKKRISEIMMKYKIKESI